MPDGRRAGRLHVWHTEPNENHDPTRGRYFGLRLSYYEKRMRGGRTQRHRDANCSPSDSNPSRSPHTSQSRILIQKRLPGRRGKVPDTDPNQEKQAVGPRIRPTDHILERRLHPPMWVQYRSYPHPWLRSPGKSALSFRLQRVSLRHSFGREPL
jgi:hypothetical protein